MNQLENPDTVEPTDQESVVKDQSTNEKNDSIKDEKTTDSENNEHNDDKDEKISELEMNIIRQIEYYFSDANLRRDKFLLEQISKDSDGWVSLDVLLKFKRLAALTTDINTIVDALTKSDEGLIEINDDKMKIRRHVERPIPEYNEEVRKEITSRTAYVKGFPLNCEMSEIIDFFKPFNKVSNIIMRKYLDKNTKSYKFKGSVFVTFDKKEQCEEFIDKEKLQYKGNDLIRKWQDNYLEEKKKEREELIAKKKSKKVKKEKNKIELPKGTVIHFDGGNENTTREVIKEAFTSLKIEVAFIEYNKGEKTGYIRLSNENAAKKFVDEHDKKLKVDSVELALRTLDENEEKTFLEKVVNQMKSKRSGQFKNKGRKRELSENDNNERTAKKCNNAQ